MTKKKVKKSDLKSLVVPLIFIILIIFSLPFIMLLLYGKFTFNFEEAVNYDNQKSFEKAGELCGEWGAIGRGSGLFFEVQCQEAPCKKSNIQGYNCVREGYTGNGFLGMKDYDTEYYICEGLGRIAVSCAEYWKYDDWINHTKGILR